MRRTPLLRLPLLAAGFAALVFGVGAGLARLGVVVPTSAASLAALHGPLMIGGFLGVVISLERAVAIGRAWAYLGPLFAGLGGVALIAGAAGPGAWLLVAASVVLSAASIDIFRRQRAAFTLTLVAGAGCWVLGNVLWAVGAEPPRIVMSWLAFLVVTIAAERLELTRFLPPAPLARRTFAATLALLGAALALGSARVFALGLAALAAWLVRCDIARRTVRAEGLTRFIAVCLLSGYAWLAVGALVILGAGGLAPGSASYDAAVHAVGLGFVFSMVFGHAPLVFPAVLRVKMPYHVAFYVPLALLHVSLAARVGGDFAGSPGWQKAGAALNALALAAFIAGTLIAVVRGRRGAAAATVTPAP